LSGCFLLLVLGSLVRLEFLLLWADCEDIAVVAFPSSVSDSAGASIHSARFMSGSSSILRVLRFVVGGAAGTVALLPSPMSVTSCEQQSICSDLAVQRKWLQGSVAASHSVSRPGPPPGRFSQPFLSAGKNARGVGRAWGLRGRQPLSAVRSRTGEGGGRVQSHPAPKPSGRAQSGGGESRGLGGWCVCVWAAGKNYVAASPRYSLFYITTARVSKYLKYLEI
jgi:hypothetical protein